MPMNRIDWRSIIIFLAAILPFCRSLGYGFINIDDPVYYVMPRIVTSGLSFDGIAWALTDLSNAIWMPITWIVYQVDYSIRNFILILLPSLDGFQVAYSIAHLQSVILHGINAVLLYKFLCLLSHRTNHLIGMLAALFWAVHPLRAESVVWIASLKDVLSMGFLLGALITWVKFRQAEDRYYYYASNTLFFLACACKPSAMTFPGMILLIDVLILGKPTIQELSKDKFKDYLPAMAIALPIALLAHYAQGIGGAAIFQSDIPFWYKALNSVVAIGVYVKNLIYPCNLAVQCQIQWPNMPHLMTTGLILGAALIFTCATATILAFQKLRIGSLSSRYLSAGFLFFLGTLLPMLGLSSFGGHAFADRFTYIPMVGFSIAMLYLEQIPWRRFITTFAVIILISLGVMSILQTGYWSNDEKLMKQTLEVDGDCNLVAHKNLARFYFEHEHTSEGLKKSINHFRRAYEINKKFCQESAIIYIMALGEAREVEKIRTIHDDFVKWLREDKNCWNSIDQDITESLCCLFESINAPQEIRDKKMKLPLKTASFLLSRPDFGVHKVDYFIHLVGKYSGNKYIEDEGLRRLRTLSDSKTGIDDAVRFRFAYK